MYSTLSSMISTELFESEDAAMRFTLHTNELIREHYEQMAVHAKFWRALNTMFPDLCADARNELQQAMDEQRLVPVYSGARVCLHTTLKPVLVRLLCYAFTEQRTPDKIDTETNGAVEAVSGYRCIRCKARGDDERQRPPVKRDFFVCCTKSLAELKCQLCRRRVYTLLKRSIYNDYSRSIYNDAQ